MLSQLTIENFGLIDRLTIDLNARLNILTGSTGAGKSIIIDGLRFALGERINASEIRDPQKPCVIEAVFELDKKFTKSEVFAEFLRDEDSLIIQRQYLPDGKTRIKVNGLTVTVSQLKVLGDHLIDFHGPHDHQLLLSRDRHLGILDPLTDFGTAKEKYSRQYEEYVQLKRQWQSLQDMADSRQRDLELLTHQVKEFSEVPLDEKKYQSVSEERTRINNAEKLYTQASLLLQILESEDGGLSEMIRKSFSPLRSLIQIDAQTAFLETHLENIQRDSKDLLAGLRDYLDGLSFSPEQAEEVNQQYDRYDDILRKYGPSLSDAARFFEEAKEKHAALENFEENTAQLEAKISQAETALKKIAAQVTAARKKSAAGLKQTIEKELKDLGIERVLFEVKITATDFGPEGNDDVSFYISPNAGEDLKPLAEIVSSGEAARVMLALKKALIKVDPVPVLIFDEIDAQIGGRLGLITGRKLKELSLERQVILITHLPQIASFADEHLKVVKKVAAGRSVTTVLPLKREERVRELAEMMSGKDQTRISLTHAETMLAEAAKS